jgi:preprotein translocase subunit SecG|tara:strand:+ start:702 stop:1037 length:336 start_codon:yes stop_codon:yes gene_type:complete
MNLDLFESLVLVFHVVAALGIIGLVLIQHGKGADMGSGFGGGASNTVFGSGGAGNFLTRLTTWIAVAFFLTSFGLAYVARERSTQSLNEGMPQIEIISETPTPEDLEVPNI